jgi:hypothetical protein
MNPVCFLNLKFAPSVIQWMANFKFSTLADVAARAACCETVA